MYDEILYPTDGSDGADAALEHALTLATAMDATLRVLYVVDTTYLGSGAAEATTVESLRTASEEVVAETVETVTDRGVEATGEIREGEPYREILADAEETGVDAVVMGTHGRRGLDRYLLGSVTEKVVRAADVPVLTVRLAEED
ncbi:universal stress protein [Halosimplex pelagicum]|uniref:Universal stress protein n=1 Tax=Halosimplex pelagicum TaxID=869886 RepID=A0A7D5TCC0_9EURY|nr:universal stress protein [Halosimplex pelagicum]QLH84490.1 universal stress protein [Halosimplex pelagicum]